MWRERLADYARPQEVKSALGWSTKVTLEVRQHQQQQADGGWEDVKRKRAAAGDSRRQLACL
jgi:hypothetical protein